MYTLEPPWPGLSLLAPRYPLWQALRSLNFLQEGGPLFETLRANRVSAEAAFQAITTPCWHDPDARSGCLRAGDPRWPSALGEEGCVPVVLTYEGDLALLSAPMVAIVGSRACTPYGRRQADLLARAVVLAGGVVVSGLARGIDCAAHEAAEGRTVAVLGQGLRSPMAAWQARVRERILERGGLVLSEFPPEQHPDRHTFPIRNRIIAGLARAVVVVEAGEKSGSRITARDALGQGREVLAVPGPVDAPASQGCLDLIEEGATVVRGPSTVLRAARLGEAQVETPAASPLAALIEEPRTPEELVVGTGMAWTEVMAELGMLELTGRAIRLPGRRYQVRPR